MNGVVPDGVDLGFLHGQELVQVCFGENEVILRFHPGASITIESDYDVNRVGPRGSHEARQRSARFCDLVLALLGSQVTGVVAHASGTLEVTFGSVSRLVVRASNGQHESYQVANQDGVVLVV